MAVSLPTRSSSQRFVFHAIGWKGYQTLLDLYGDRPVRLTYDRGNLEIMTPLPIHERYKSLIRRIIDEITMELDIPVIATASTTFRREDLDRGLEPDESYYFANAENLRDPRLIDLEFDPPPDLAIEIDITSSNLDRLSIYASLGIAEIWRFDGESVAVLRLQADGSYAVSKTSGVLPFVPMKDVARWLYESNLKNDTAWGRGVREWVRRELVPLMPHE